MKFKILSAVCCMLGFISSAFANEKIYVNREVTTHIVMPDDMDGIRVGLMGLGYQRVQFLTNGLPLTCQFQKGLPVNVLVGLDSMETLEYRLDIANDGYIRLFRLCHSTI